MTQRIDFAEAVRLICDGAGLGPGALAEMLLESNEPRKALACRLLGFAERNPDDIDAPALRELSDRLKRGQNVW